MTIAVTTQADFQTIARWVIFGITYIGIAIGGFPKLVIDRVGVALLGAIAMLAVQGISIREAVSPEIISYETILLLFGLMIFSAQLRVAGFYAVAGKFLTRLTDRPRVLLAGLIAISALLSAVLANDIVCLAFTPLLCDALLAARRNPLPYLLALATSSNIGSAATIIGNPQNMHIGAHAGLAFGHFSLIMLPPVVVGLVLNYWAVIWMFGKKLGEECAMVSPARSQIRAHEGETLVPSSLPLQTRDEEPDWWLIYKTLGLMVGLVIVFLFVGGEARAIAALAGAGVLLLSHRAKAARLYQFVDWNLLLLFLGLFVVNGAVKPLVAEAFAHVRSAGVNVENPLTLSGVTLVLSNLVSNVPAVLLLQTPIDAAPVGQRLQLWYLLALVSTWAGNLTLVGSIANLIVAESAAAFGVKVGLKDYCKLGVPLTIVTVVLGVGWILWVM